MDQTNGEMNRRPASAPEVVKVLAPINAAIWPSSKAKGLLELMETIEITFIPANTSQGTRRAFLLTVTPSPTALEVKRYLGELVGCQVGLSSLNIILFELSSPLASNTDLYNVPKHVIDRYLEDRSQPTCSPPILFPQWQYYVDNLISRADEATPAPLVINQKCLPEPDNGKSGEWPIIQLQNSPALNIRGIIDQARNILDTYGVLVLRPQSGEHFPDDKTLKKLFSSIKSCYIQEGSGPGFLFKHQHEQVALSLHNLRHGRTKITLTEQVTKNKVDRKVERRVLHDILAMRIEHEPVLYEADTEWVHALCNSSNLSKSVATALLQLPVDPGLHFEKGHTPLVIRQYESSELLHKTLDLFGKSIHQFFQPDCILSHALLFHRCNKDRAGKGVKTPLSEQNIEHLLEEVLVHPKWNQVPLFHGDTRYTFQTSGADTFGPAYQVYFNFYGEKEEKTWVLLNKKQRQELEKHMPHHPSNLPIAPTALAVGNVPFVAGQQKKGDIVIVSPGTMWYNWGRYISVGLSMNLMLDSTVTVSNTAQDEVSQAFRELANEVAEQTNLLDSTWKKVFSRSLEPLYPIE